MNYLLGAAGQHAAAARVSPRLDRSRFLREAVERWAASADRDERSFVSAASRRLVAHDDREQFLAGVDLILRGANS
ncbi:hypothetical protein [Leucobacter sp. wl10]|uniref:hypothetical protein n=1 Tax=Leucobacter sp. wl10 TaxID=2304677 RepID=UPI0013C31806|nr:hypothetical protein [Leucobacter sp. wl10]